MPWKEEDKWVQYHDGQKQFKVPFIMYADFESILEPMENRIAVSMETIYREINRHISSGFFACTTNLHMEMFQIHLKFIEDKTV